MLLAFPPAIGRRFEHDDLEIALARARGPRSSRRPRLRGRGPSGSSWRYRIRRPVRRPVRTGGARVVITPIFRLDSREKWRPQPAETAEELATINGDPVNLAGLPETGGRMDFPSTMRDPTDTPLVGYHRVVEAADLWWHQFRLWYLYNPWNVAGFGQHEGDWEFLQLGLRRCGGRPSGPDDGISASGGREAGVLAMRARQQTSGRLRGAGIARQLLHPGRSRRGRRQRAGAEPLEGSRGASSASGRRCRTCGRFDRRGLVSEFPRNEGDRWRLPHLYHAAAR